MQPFQVMKDEEKISSVNRTIRLKPEIFDQLMSLSEDTGVSFNKIVNQCIEYAIDSMNNSEEL